jgi:hypothetical protein
MKSLMCTPRTNDVHVADHYDGRIVITNRTFRLLFVAVALVACRSHDAPPRAPEIATTRIAELKASLKQALGTALAERGPAGAIATCSEIAPRLAERLSTSPVRIGRTTRRTRNSANAAVGWRLAALDHFEAIRPTERPGAIYATRLPGGGTGVAEPLIVDDVCLVCHGENLAPDVAAALAERYPDDRATGYARGDLRGIVWAEVEPE